MTPDQHRRDVRTVLNSTDTSELGPAIDRLEKWLAEQDLTLNPKETHHGIDRDESSTEQQTRQADGVRAAS